jgi:hypothetical protein
VDTVPKRHLKLTGDPLPEDHAPICHTTGQNDTIVPPCGRTEAFRASQYRQVTGFSLGIEYAALESMTFWGREVSTMNSCHAFHPEHAQGKDQLDALDFTGNQPALPPLTTEAVETIVYLMDDVELSN